MTPVRSLLFIPGNKASMLAKAAGLAPDVLVPDMEDSVPDAEKASARSTIVEWLPRLAAHAALLLPRVNAIRTDWFEDDVAAVAVPGVYGISIGKVESAGDVSLISAALARCERNIGLDSGSLRLVPWIETARAIVNCYEICTASERIAAVAFGGEDYTADLGIERLDDESNLIYARSTICNAARAAGVLALDTPYFQFRDRDGLESSSLAAKRLGFKGRFAIHPDQIEAINACFSPSEAEIEEAKRIVAAFEAAERTGRGSTSLDGRVIDVPVVKRAKALLAQAGSAG
ncbi:MAG TPA: CoA ester lyase [Gammaproteobacteria bacterium]|nr:CoA ester lyase [Gammaproteobacteria bacterium]